MPSRRAFLKSSAATLAAAPLVNAYVGGSETLKVGLVGCGNRGSGAIDDALQADPNVKLWALADAFGDRLESCLDKTKKAFPNKVDVTTDRCFTGLDG